MKTIAPDYYREFACVAGACLHTCCVGWEIDVDEESTARFSAMADVAPHLSCDGGVMHIELLPGERCPFLTGSGLCQMILDHGDGVLCGICRDHPRFRSFFTGRVEIGLGVVCEAAARLILGRQTPMRLVVIDDDGVVEELPEDEAELIALRDSMMREVREDAAPLARFHEYLIYRHLPDALYDDRLDARCRFIDETMISAREVYAADADGFAEWARAWSYDTEYDEEALDAILDRLSK